MGDPQTESAEKINSSAEEGFFPEEGEIFSAHWHIFMPTVVICALYLLGYGVLLGLERGDSALARLVLLVITVGVPLLAAHALLRFYTSRVQIAEDHIRYHLGWPKRLPVDVPLVLIDSTRVRRGLSGRLFGGGTLEITLTTGQRINVPDLKDPENVQTALNEAINAAQQYP